MVFQIKPLIHIFQTVTILSIICTELHLWQNPLMAQTSSGDNLKKTVEVNEVDPVEEEMWQLVKDTQESEELEFFLQSFPNSKRKPIVELKLNLLKKKETPSSQEIEEEPKEVESKEEVSQKVEEEPKEEVKVPDEDSLFKSIRIAGGFGIYQLPIEADLEAEGNPLEILIDIDIDDQWLKFRGGYNRSEQKLKVLSENFTLTTNTFYAAYRYSMSIPIVDTLEGFVLMGVGWMISDFEGTEDSETGLLFGLGTFYDLSKKFSIGSQFQIIKGSGEFDEFKIATGSNQLQFIVSYNLW